MRSDELVLGEEEEQCGSTVGMGRAVQVSIDEILNKVKSITGLKRKSNTRNGEVK